MKPKETRRAKPTKQQIHRTLEATQHVDLAAGYSDAYESPWVRNYTESRKIEYPKFGKWKSFEDIKAALRKKIDERYPLEAFPFRKLGKITLYCRNESDRAYLSDMGDFSADEQ